MLEREKSSKINIQQLEDKNSKLSEESIKHTD
jgi:hypothetical protein